MSFPFPQNTHLAVIALVSALLILKVTKRAPERPLLKNLKDASAEGVTGQLLPEPEYDIVIVGGGEFAFVFARLGSLSDKDLL
jgi:hypothetical protein